MISTKIRRTNDKLRKEIKRLRKKGLKLREISRKLNVTDGCIVATLYSNKEIVDSGAK